MNEYQAISTRLAVLVHDQTGEILFELSGENAYNVAKTATKQPEWGTPYQDNAIKHAISELGGAVVSYSLYPCPGIPDSLLSTGYFCQLEREQALAFSVPTGVAV